MSKSISVGLKDYSRRILSISRYLQAQSKDILYYSGKSLGAKEFKNKNSETLENALTKISDSYMQLSQATLRVGRLGSDFLAAELHGCPTCVEAEHDGATYCWIDAGYIAGALETMLKKRFVVIETKCRGTGYNFCEFIVTEDRKIETKKQSYTVFKRFESPPM